MIRTVVVTIGLLASAAGVAQTAPIEPVAAPATVPAAAPAAVATPAAAPAVAEPAAPPLPTDRRERVQAVCLNEAKAKAKSAGATDVIVKDVQDTDLKSDGYASMRAKVELVSVDSKGKTKRKKGTFGCATRNDTIVNFSFD